MTDEAMERIPTHVPGLDIILEGGFLRGGVYIIEGPPGVGKTTLGSHFCFNHAARGGRALYVTLLAESHTRLLAHLRRMRFFDASLVPEHVSFISAFKVLEADGLSSLLKLVRQTMTAQKISVVVLDGLVSAEEASSSAKEFKKFIHELQVIAAMASSTVLLLNSTERPRGFRPERTMVDGIIELDDEMVSLRCMRHLAVRKMRGASPVRGRHHMEITDDGVRVLPRIETVGVHSGLRKPSDERARHAFGIAELDRMTRGGLSEGSVTAVVGPSGSGKTLLGLHFLHEGMTRREPGVYFGFFERPAPLLAKTQRLGIDLSAAHEAGQVQLHWHRPVEGVIDEIVDKLIGAVKASGARRLVIDGLEGLRAAAESSDRLREVTSCVVDELENLQVTTMYTSETPDLFGDNLQLSMLGMSALTHNIILLKHTDRGPTTQRSVTVLKLRDSDHDLSFRTFAITNRGIIVARAAPDDEPKVEANSTPARQRSGAGQRSPKGRKHRA